MVSNFQDKIPVKYESKKLNTVGKDVPDMFLCLVIIT